MHLLTSSAIKYAIDGMIIIYFLMQEVYLAFRDILYYDPTLHNNINNLQ